MQSRKPVKRSGVWIFSTATESPYLKHPGRLPDILAAIQVMGAHRNDSQALSKWRERLGNEPVSAKNREEIFNDHPEFFQPRDKEDIAEQEQDQDQEQGKRWVLTWRLAYEPVYAYDQGTEYSREEAKRLREEAKQLPEKKNKIQSQASYCRTDRNPLENGD